ncbi:GtrA family protein [Paenibacillus sinopodophylli]|uniref:GtrA family protein n=1 Tax=Paenibacillus sinopodophylli TaxID=1837342 RepID=UPI00110CF873|nr:GtrA family protein [Paenibacillus sinopodophylli]
MSRFASKKLIIQFLTFNAVGLINTAIDFLIFTLLVWFGVFYLIAQIIGYGAGMINSYVLNSRYTFQKDHTLASNKQKMSRGIKFTVWNVTLLGISLLLLTILTGWWGLNEVVAKAIVTVITLGLNFYGSKKWVFTASKPQIESS